MLCPEKVVFYLREPLVFGYFAGRWGTGCSFQSAGCNLRGSGHDLLGAGCEMLSARGLVKC